MTLNPVALVALRTLAGYTQAGLARRAGLSQGYLSQLESGDKKPSPPTLRKLADALRIPMSALLRDHQPNGNESDGRRPAGRNRDRDR